MFKMGSVMKNTSKAVVYGSILTSLVLLSSCVIAMSGSGRLQRRLEVEQLFDSGTILPNHSYYSEGPLSEPDAIIAISNEFRLQTKLWTKRDWTTKELAESVRWIRINEFGLCRADAGVLLAPDGKEIGIWFSKKNGTIIRQPVPGVVEVYPFVYQGSSPCGRQDYRENDY